MLHLIWPIAIIVASNTLYNICTKAIPGQANPFASLCVTYLAAAGVSLTLFLLTSSEKNFPAALGQLNWASLILGGAITGLEFGYVAAFRAGWPVSLCSLTANIILACVLLLVGVAVYQETVTLRQAAGMTVCGLGLFLISSHG